MSDENVKPKKKHKALKITLIVIASLVIICLVAIQLATLYLYDQTFGVRYSSENNSGLYRRENYDIMNQYRVEFSSDKGQKLVGYIYEPITDISFKGVIVLNHGFGGGGHESYLPVISRLNLYGYMVFGFDKTGNDESEGDSVIGFPQGVIDLNYALGFVRTNEHTKNLPIILFGHSWGAYSVCAALEENTDIVAAVSISGFDSANDVLVSQGAEMYGDVVNFMAPFLTMCDIFKFGSKAFYSSQKGLSKTNAEVLLIHSADDPLIPVESSFDLYKEKFDDRSNIHFMKLGFGGHEPFMSYEAKQYISESRRKINKLKDENGGELTEEVMQAYVQGYDLETANSINEELMENIISFLDKSVKSEQNDKENTYI